MDIESGKIYYSVTLERAYQVIEVGRTRVTLLSLVEREGMPRIFQVPKENFKRNFCRRQREEE